MYSFKIKLTKKAFEILTGELEFNQMGALYLMGLGKGLPENITKLDLLTIIGVLCKHLGWIEEYDSLRDVHDEESKPPEIAVHSKEDSEIFSDEDLDTNDIEKILQGQPADASEITDDSGFHPTYNKRHEKKVRCNAITL